MRLSAEDALRLRLLDKAGAQAIKNSQRRGGPVLSSAVAALNAEKLANLDLSQRSAPSGSVDALSPAGLKAGTAAYNDAHTNPQRIIYNALCERLPGRVEWEVKDLIPDRQFRADIRVGCQSASKTFQATASKSSQLLRCFSPPFCVA